MKPVLICLTVLVFIFMACERKPLSRPDPSETRSVPKVIVEKGKMEKEQPLPSEVKIKLRRDGKDNYTWELNGSDVDQILKVNEKLRRQLTGDQTR
jgi:hypothetical protein